LKLGVLGPFPCWSVLGQFNCPKYVLLWHYSRLPGFLSRYFWPPVGPQVVTVPPIFPIPKHPNGWCVSVNAPMKETAEIFSTRFQLEFKNYFALSGFLSICSLLYISRNDLIYFACNNNDQLTYIPTWASEVQCKVTSYINTCRNKEKGFKIFVGK
jgi:hypothetical protein